VTGAKDTFMHAPPISLHSYAKLGYTMAGMYSDQVRDSLANLSSKFLLMGFPQVIYYQHCKLKSTHNQATQHLAYIDWDEFLLPAYLVTPRSSWTSLSLNLSRVPLHTSLATYLATLDLDVASLCIKRRLMNGLVAIPSDMVDHGVWQSAPPQLMQVSKVSRPTLQPKCIHHAARHFVASVQ
jgi:hypothetical protein